MHTWTKLVDSSLRAWKNTKAPSDDMVNILYSSFIAFYCFFYKPDPSPVYNIYSDLSLPVQLYTQFPSSSPDEVPQLSAWKYVTTNLLAPALPRLPCFAWNELLGMPIFTIIYVGRWVKDYRKLHDIRYCVLSETVRRTSLSRPNAILRYAILNAYHAYASSTFAAIILGEDQRHLHATASKVRQISTFPRKPD